MLILPGRNKNLFASITLILTKNNNCLKKQPIKTHLFCHK